MKAGEEMIKFLCKINIQSSESEYCTTQKTAQIYCLQ